MDESSLENLDYIAGFDAGCNYMIREIENYAKANNVFLGDLLKHLTQELNNE